MAKLYSPVPWRTCQKRTTRWAVAAVSRAKFSRAASSVCGDGRPPGRAQMISSTVAQPKSAARENHHRIGALAVHQPVHHFHRHGADRRQRGDGLFVFAGLGVFGDVGLGEFAFLMQRAHRAERGGIIARRGFRRDLVGHLRQHAADLGLRLGLRLRQQPLAPGRRVACISN